jgi:hypothetical protein
VTPPKKAGRPKKAPAKPSATSAGRADAAPKGQGRPSKDAQLTEKLADLYALVGVGVTWFSPDDGRLVIERSEVCAASLVKWSKENAAVARALDRLTTGSALGAVLIAHGGLMWAIAANHQLLPAPNLAAGDGSPDGFGSSPASALGVDFAAMANDPRKVALLSELFDLDPTPAPASNGSG